MACRNKSRLSWKGEGKDHILIKVMGAEIVTQVVHHAKELGKEELRSRQMRFRLGTGNGWIPNIR